MAIERSTRTVFISGASVLSLVIVASAYALSGPLPFHTNKAGAESTHDLLVSYASKDTDADGLPDWQESLYGTDPNNAHSVNPTMSDADAVAQGLVQPKFATATSTSADSSIIPGVDAGPTTLTDQFSKRLFGEYLKNRGGAQPSAEEIATFVEKGIAELKQSQIQQNAFNQGQISVSGTGPDALLVYAAEAEQAFVGTKFDGPKTEVEYFGDAALKNDSVALKHVSNYGNQYAQLARSLMKIKVPKELAVTHLALANSLMRLSNSVSDMGTLDKDPIRAMLGMTTYQDNAVSFNAGLVDMKRVFVAESVVPGTGTTGSVFYGLMSNAYGKK